jgi:hypothetical protein
MEYMKLVIEYMKLVTIHAKLVTGHDKKLNFLKTGHKTNWSGWSWAGRDQTRIFAKKFQMPVR